MKSSESKAVYQVNALRYLDFDREQKARRRRWLKRGRILIGGFLLLALLAGGLILWQRDSLLVFLRPISFVAQLINPIHLKETDGRVNVLIMGLDTREDGGLLNTDTIFVGSFSLTEGDPILISIPRDLWVRSDSVRKGWQGKINTAYANAAVQNGVVDKVKGVAAAKSVVEEVLGIQLHYWAVVDFEGFKGIIDALGGVEVCVEHAFDDYQYPSPGRENSPRPYEHLHFDAGCQLMDGERALKYSRSRMGTAGEGSDFARIRRQQRVIMAVKDKIFSLSLLFEPGKLTALYQQFIGMVETNVSLSEARRALEIASGFQDLGETKTLVLDPESGLTSVGNPVHFGGYVLLPKGGSLAAIHQAVQKMLLSSVEEAQTAED